MMGSFGYKLLPWIFVLGMVVHDGITITAFAMEHPCSSGTIKTYQRRRPSGQWAKDAPSTPHCQRSIQPVRPRQRFVLRGGSRDEPTPDSPVVSSVEQRRYQRGMSLALSACYFTVMGAKCALPATLSLLTSPDIGLTFGTTGSLNALLFSSTSPSQAMARHLTCSTLAIALGKIVLGPVIDSLGGNVSLQITLAALTLLLGAISVGQSFATFAVAWIGIDFLFSSCWAACLHAIHDAFPSSDWSLHIGRLAAAARAGNSMALAIFATILSYSQAVSVRQYWRPVFAVAALAQLVPLVLLRRHARRPTTPRWNKPTSHTSPAATPWSVVRRQAQTLDFWLHLASRSALMVFASFLLFVPTFMTQIHHTSASVGARVGALYALGCLGAVTTLSRPFAQWKRRTRVQAVIGLLLGATASSALQWAHVSGWVALTPTVSALLLGVWGFCFAIPFYIPPSLYALSQGGAESSATLADVLDICGFALLAWFNGYVAGIVHADPWAWRTPFAVTTLCALVSLVTLGIAVGREATH